MRTSSLTTCGFLHPHKSDVLVLRGSAEALAQVAEDHSFLMLAPFKGEVRRPRKALAAGLVMLGTVLGATVSQVGLGPAALTGATAMVLTRCLTPRQAYRAIDVRMFVSWPAPSRSARP